MPETAETYDSATRSNRPLAEARELWRFRHLVRELVVRDITVRYKRSFIGIGWTLLGPLLQMAALTVAFSAIMRVQIANYPVYFLAGSLFWNFFAQATGHAANLTTDALELSKRVYLPRSAFVASAIGVALVNLVLSLIPLLLIALATGYPPGPTWFFLPVSILIGAAFTAGVGLVVFTLACRFVDVRDTYLVLLQPWFFLTPILYPKEIVPEKFQALMRYNPMTYLVEVFRAPIYDGWLPGWKTLLFSVLAAVVSLAVGWWFYASRIDDYAARS
ncbi:MAG: ABC transporter permease [Holophagales bacterium]|nr:ABC transporter permease [Holophagales bacterium]MBK9963627.1 ABC transporter permease [Holophagales bacterium]